MRERENKRVLSWEDSIWSTAHPSMMWNRLLLAWDQIGCSVPNSNGNMKNWSLRMTQLRGPSWVSADDELARVTWTESAKSDLFQARQHVEPFYDNGSIEEACRAIEEIIAQDPRAMRDGRGKTNNEAFEFTFCQFRIQFVVLVWYATTTWS